jgi:hypothetical protein
LIFIQKEAGGSRRKLCCSLESGSLTSLVIQTASLVLFYYATSIGLTFYQNWLLKVPPFCPDSAFQKVPVLYPVLIPDPALFVQTIF